MESSGLPLTFSAGIFRVWAKPFYLRRRLVYFYSPNTFTRIYISAPCAVKKKFPAILYTFSPTRQYNLRSPLRGENMKSTLQKFPFLFTISAVIPSEAGHSTFLPR